MKTCGPASIAPCPPSPSRKREGGQSIHLPHRPKSVLAKSLGAHSTGRPDVKNRLYYGDNLDILRRTGKGEIASESVDLCTIDPPFNSKRKITRKGLDFVRKYLRNSEKFALPKRAFSCRSTCYCADMAVSLLRGPTVVSLEFEPEDKEVVKAAVRESFGEPKVTQHGISSTVQIDGEEFTYQNEWDDPCLITSTARGAEILQAIADKVGHTSI